ncbi:hypothetical protein GLOTRDRAFT_126844 [Gloeophyllum trabeum ATCC 11539]|uniref:BRCT domain-containing protein n=1 Tax=Gloeophyllum trabeum (strain ATCC 11539 / FP-39264 / Madison 617) TaxID=670483 RepID=S7RZ59_GLOTA|nr:uncharacterized protein GLOTRDRAFT_126844 [Gloeophyllum trabeum ATCC 11539]EPQ58729.1 hypothetical protein GLOTRDRAFT_126844 [Gloeophyllum trabeum ATCC 11539]
MGQSSANSSTDTSGDSSIPRTSVPVYHFHGLAATQTQSQYDDGPSNEDSQKENTPAPHDSRSQCPSTPGHQSSAYTSSGSKSPNKVSSQGDDNLISESPARKSENTTAILDGVTPDISSNTTRSPFKDKVPLFSRPTKVVSFISPNPKSNPSGPSVAQRRGMSASRPVWPDPPSPASQDSFIDPLPEPDKVFIATSREFAIPLSQLGAEENSEDSSQSQAEGLPRGGQHATSSSAMLPGTRRIPTPRVPSPTSNPSRVETVLVASTPSNSDSSQSSVSQANRWDDSQDSDLYPNRQRSPSPPFPYDANPSSAARDESQETQVWQPTQLVDDASQPPSDDAHHYPPSTVIATQATEYQETQIISDPGDTDEPLREHIANALPAKTVAASAAPSSTSNTTGMGPSSLLSLVPAHKRQRYAGIVPELRRDRVPDVPAIPERQFMDEPEATQIIEDEESAPPTNSSSRRFPPAAPQDSRHGKGSAADEPSEVVPDSEPARLESSPSIPLADLMRPSRGTSVGAHLSKDRQDAASEEEEARESLYHRGRRQGSNSGNKGKRKMKDSTRESAIEPVGRSSYASARDNHGVASLGASDQGKHAAKEDEVPSSVPDQDLRTNPKTSTGLALAANRRAATRRKATGNNRERGMDVESNADSETEEPDDSCRGIAGPSNGCNAFKEEEEETEPEDREDGGDVAMNGSEEEAEVSRPTPSKSVSRKRKRSNTVARGKSRATSRTPTAKGSYAPSIASTAERSSKRARTTTPSQRQLRGTRVFALWRQDGHYYPGVILGATAELNCYTVFFDDNTRADVEISKMRRCRLREGDNVLIAVKMGNGKKQRVQRARVVEVQGETAQSSVRVEIDQLEGVEELQVCISEIVIAGKTITTHWNDRLLDPSDIGPVQHTTTRQSPRTQVETDEAVNKVIYKTAFVISSSITDPQPNRERTVNIIKNSGGIVVDDWISVIRMEGQFISDYHWVAHQKDVKWCGHQKIDKIFLLSDDCSTKPKFLMALALGIPCVDIRWIQECGERDWQSYLLPAGFSETLQARISQMIDLDWGNSVDYVQDIMNNAVAPKLFSNKSVLCVDEKFVPVPAKTVGKKKATASRGEMSCIPQIILAMGASTVEAATESCHLAQDALRTYDYVVVRTLAEVESVRKDGVTVVTWDWVKDCLIAGRLFDMPA